MAMRQEEFPWETAAREMQDRGITFVALPQIGDGGPFMWQDALCFFWVRNERLPTAVELALEMLEEWDDPCGIDEAQNILDLIRS